MFQNTRFQRWNCLKSCAKCNDGYLEAQLSYTENMARPGRFELPTSCSGGGLSTAGLHGMSRLDVRLSATVGFIGHGRHVFVQRFVQRLLCLPEAAP